MTVIEKVLQDFVKLQTWEDRGYLSIKRNGERAQRKLHKLSQKAEEVLKQPVALVLYQAIPLPRYKEPYGIEPAPARPIPIQTKTEINLVELLSTIKSDARKLSKSMRQRTEYCSDKHISRGRGPNLGQSILEGLKLNRSELRFNRIASIAQKMKELVDTSETNWMDDVGTVLQETCQSIVDRIETLQKDRSKAARGRKRKALSDFLKLLAELGISKRKVSIPKGKSHSNIDLS